MNFGFFWQKKLIFFLIIPWPFPGPMEHIHTQKPIFIAIKMVQNDLKMASKLPKNGFKMEKIELPVESLVVAGRS